MAVFSHETISIICRYHEHRFSDKVFMKNRHKNHHNIKKPVETRSISYEKAVVLKKCDVNAVPGWKV